MKDITADNIEKSFYEIEKGLSSNGVAPLDAYVVDDGWVDYKSGFWSFNKSFLTNFMISLSLPLISALNSACGSVHVAVTAGLIYLQRKWKNVVSEHIMQRLRTFV